MTDKILGATATDLGPRIKAYHDAVDAAHRAHRAARDAVWDAYRASLFSEEAGAARRAAYSAAYAACDAACDAAWETLTAHADPLVRWIGANAREYEEEVLEVLEALPCSLVDLDFLAANRERPWCEEWERFKALAREAGVL